MKRILLISLIFVVIASAGYFVYKTWAGQPSRDIWQLVPGNAVLVYESSNLAESWNNFINTTVWKNLSLIPAFGGMNRSIDLLDSLSGRSGSFDKITRSKKLLISLHQVEKNNFDFIFFLTLQNSEDRQIAVRLIDNFKKKTGHQLTERTYQGVTLYELKDVSGNKTFSFIYFEDYFVGSFTPFLVEDVIRLLKEGLGEGFANQNERLFTLPALVKDDGNLYLNYSNLAYFLGGFVKEDRTIIQQVKAFANAGFLDLTINDKAILMNGFSVTDYADKKQFLNLFKGQLPHKIGIKPYIPEHTDWLYHFSFQKPVEWANALDGYNFSKVSTTARDFAFDINRFRNWMGEEIALISMESSNAHNPNRLIFLKSRDVTEALNQLNSYAQNLVTAAGDTLYYESYGDIEIKELLEKDFPEKLLGPLFQYYEQCFYMILGNYVVLGNKIPALKTLIDDIEAENTWGKLLSRNNFLENTLSEANFSIIFNTQEVWQHLIAKLDEDWRKFAMHYSPQLKSFEMGAVQFSRVDNNFYTSVALSCQGEIQLAQTEQKFEVARATQFDVPIISKPFVVRNHVNNSFEVLVQDSAARIYLVDKSGSILWSDTVESAFTSKVTQVDYYKNNKLQYFFTTGTSAYLIDRVGNAVESFPLQLGYPASHASVIDYDKSKRYRFLISDQSGNLYMYNKEGKNLEGWQPRKLSGRLAAAPRHIRVRGRDCIIAVQENGVVNVMNRRGEMREGFPVELGERTRSPLFVQIGSDFKQTVFSAVTLGGRVVRFNLLGEALNQNQLYKPAKESTYQLIPDVREKKYIIAQQDFNRLSLLDAEGKTLIEKDYLSSGQLQVQYYDFGVDKKLYAISDPDQEFTYIYDKDGELINYQPAESAFPISLIYSNRKFNIYTCYDKYLKVLTF